MRVDRLKLEYFRNYLSAEVAFHPGMNIIIGENAQGKTNLLEAVAYLSTARSHRARYDKEMLLFGVSHGFITGEITSRGREHTVEIALSEHGRRQMSSNGVKLKKASQLSDVLNTVLFCPEDLYLIRAGAAERRKFLDDTISQLRPRYADALEQYTKAWKAKSAILRNQEEQPQMLEVLDDFSLQMCKYGAVITHYRAHFIKRLNELAPPIHRECSGGKEALSLVYEPESTITDPLSPTKVLLEQIMEHMEQYREAELASRKCLTGPHRDELAIYIDGRLARQYASQGQTRTAALSLKIAQRDLMYDETGEFPVLLLDDVLSELDPRRQEFVLNRIRGGQVLLTCCEEERLSELEEGKVFRVKEGRIREDR